MTHEEATKIIEISQRYIPSETLKSLFHSLDEEVGKVSDNKCLKEATLLLRYLIDPPMPPPKWWMWTGFYVLVVLHFALVVAVALAFCLLPFLSPWYIAVPLMTFVFFFSTTRVECQLTNIENVLRKRLGMKQIGGFVGHYMIKPAKKANDYLLRAKARLK